MHARLVLIAALALAACKGDDGSLVVSMTSTLEIPDETDRIVVRILDGTNVLEEESNTIGEPPRDRYPLVQQINRGASSPESITVVAELRKNTPNGTLLLVGNAVVETELPKTGRKTIDLEVGRACEDRDGDEWGFGVGCRGLDCDDSSSSHPEPTECPMDPPDGGVREDSGIRDRLCGDAQVMCQTDEVCFREICRKPCSSQRECDSNFTCNTAVGFCICNLPCDGNMRCRPGTCERGCCVGG